MKKFFSVFLTTAILALYFTAVIPAATASPMPSPKMTSDISALAHIYNSTTTLQTTTVDGIDCIKITPNTTGATGTEITLDVFTLGISAADLESVNYVAINYKYIPSSTRGAKSNMGLLMMPQSGALTGWVSRNSLNNILEGVWGKIVFDVDFSSLVNTSSGARLNQMHLYPFGKSCDPKSISASEIMYLGDIEFWETDPREAVTVGFSCKVPHATGTTPERIAQIPGTKYTLPQNPYTVKGGTFLGWRYSADGQLYAPGTQMTVPLTWASFNAEFDYTEEIPPYISLNFANYCSGVMENKDTAIVKKTVFDGKNVVMVQPNPNGTNKNTEIILDTNWVNESVDLNQYKHMLITYYFDGNIPSGGDKYISAGFSTLGDVLTTYKSIRGIHKLASRYWAYSLFNLNLDSAINPEATNTDLRQIHLRIVNGVPASAFSGNERIYINRIIFFKDTPKIDIHMPYMEGYDTGLFEPNEPISRAEVCAIIARKIKLLDGYVPTGLSTKYTDVKSTSWYYKYISYLESIGLLTGFPAGNFYPDEDITLEQFSDILIKYQMFMDGKNLETNKTLSYPNINSAPLSRAEAIMLLNDVSDKTTRPEQLSEDVKYLYSDVSRNHWAYGDIAEAVLHHVENTEDGNWVSSLTDTKELLGGDERINVSAGAAKVSEIDTLTAQRISEIRSTPNMNLSKITGTKYYVSSSTGNDSNDGKSPERAWKTTDKVTAMRYQLKPGDAVLFKRGDTWHQKASGGHMIYCESGITYSSYGSGAKPVLYGSSENGADPSKWTLVSGTTNIWQYATKMTDVGELVFNKDSSSPQWSNRAEPDLYNGVFYVRKTNHTERFDVKTHLTQDLDYFHYAPNNNFRTEPGTIYLRCDRGNPGNVFDTIDFIIRGAGFYLSSTVRDVTIDNFTTLFFGTGGVSGSNVVNLTVQNTEAGWMGGIVHWYSGPQNDGMIRMGNGLGNYGMVDATKYDNCYVYQCYDAGISPQISSEEGNIRIDDVIITNNVIERCIYSFEHFLVESADGVGEREGRNFRVENNIMRMAGYGMGQTRPNGNGGTHIQGKAGSNKYTPGTFIIRNNIFDRSTYLLVNSCAIHDMYLPLYSGNTFIQVNGMTFGFHNGSKLMFDSGADMTAKYILGDEASQVYWLDDSYRFTYRGYTY